VVLAVVLALKTFLIFSMTTSSSSLWVTKFMGSQISMYFLNTSTSCLAAKFWSSFMMDSIRDLSSTFSRLNSLISEIMVFNSVLSFLLLCSMFSSVILSSARTLLWRSSRTLKRETAFSTSRVMVSAAGSGGGVFGEPPNNPFFFSFGSSGFLNSSGIGVMREWLL